MDIKLSDLTVIIANIYRAASEDFEGVDADHTLKELIARLDATVTIDKDLLERALFIPNLLNEDGKFWHPENQMFFAFVGAALGRDYRFNRDYGWITPLKEKQHA